MRRISQNLQRIGRVKSIDRKILKESVDAQGADSFLGVRPVRTIRACQFFSEKTERAFFWVDSPFPKKTEVGLSLGNKDAKIANVNQADSKIGVHGTSKIFY